MLRLMFPDQEILRNHKYVDIRFEKSQRFAEFDIFLPSLAMVFEYPICCQVLFSK